MKNIFNYLLAFMLLTILPSCEVVGGIFRAGMIWGTLLVIGFIALIVVLISKVGKK